MANVHVIRADGGLLIPVLSADPSSPANGTLWYNSTSNTFKQRANGSTSEIGSSSSFADNVFAITDNSDPTKVLAFQVSGVTTGTTRTITMADADVDLADINNAYSALGVTLGDIDLGAFTGAILGDNENVKSALQVIETFLESDVLLLDGSQPMAAALAMGSNQITGLAAGSGTGHAVNFDQAILADGTNAFTANQAMGGFKLTGLGAATTSGDAVRYEQAILANGANAFTADQSMGLYKLTSLGTPTAAADAATKAYVDAAIVGLDFQPDVNDLVADATTTSPDNGLPTAATGQRYILESGTGSLETEWGTITGVGDNDIVEYNGSAWFVAYDVSVEGEGALVWDQNNDVFLKWDGASWTEFGGLAGITAGQGLTKSGSTLHIDLLAAGGLEITPADDSGQLGIKLDGTTLTVGAGGLKVSTGGIANNEIDASAAIAFSKLAALSDGNILVGNGSNVATSVAVSGEASIDNTGAMTLSNAAVIGKVLTGFTTGSGNVAATDTILEAFQKLQSEKLAGPTSATDNALVRFDATTGKLVQDSGVTLDDNWNMSGLVGLQPASGTLKFMESASVNNFYEIEYQHSVELEASQAGAVLYFLPHDTYRGVIITYKITDTVSGNESIGWLRAVTDGTTTSIDESFSETGSTGISWAAVINGANLQIRYNSGANACEMHAEIKRFLV